MKILNIYLGAEILFFITRLYIWKLQVSVAHRMESNILISGSVCTSTVSKGNSTLLFVNCFSFWSPKIMKDEFDTAVVSAINKVFPHSVITGCNFHFSQCLWRKLQNTEFNVLLTVPRIQNTGLTEVYKENEQVRTTYRMCAALYNYPLVK